MIHVAACRRWLTLVLAAWLGAVAITTGIAAEEPVHDELPAPSPRQYYSPWRENASEGYFYRTFYFKADPAADAYDRHYVVSYPGRDDYLYFYDPTTRLFWGRVLRNGEEGWRFSLIHAIDRQKRVSDIPEAAYTDLGPMPVLPGANDGVTIISPTSPESGDGWNGLPAHATKRSTPATPAVKPPPPKVKVYVRKPKPFFREEERTVYERRWISTVTYVTAFRNGRACIIPIYSGYYITVPVTKKVQIANF